MSSITIGKKKYEVFEKLLDQNELQFYEDNPRVYSILRENGKAHPSQEEIEKQLKSMEHVKQLKLSIEQNGGLIDPLIVVKRNNEYVVLEGNSRLAAYRLLSEKDPVEWQFVRTNVLPSDISDDEIFTLLGQYHLIGRKDWSIFEQAAYLYRQKQSSNLDNDIIAKRVGLEESRVNMLLKVYTFMYEHDDLRPDRWSYYEEYLKNRGIKKYRETSSKIDEVFVKGVKTGEYKEARDVRNVLGEVAKSTDKTAKKIMQKYIDGEGDIYKGHEKLVSTGKTTTGYQRIKRFRETITDEDFQTEIKLESSKNKDLAFELKKIQQSITRLLKDMNKIK